MYFYNRCGLKNNSICPVCQKREKQSASISAIAWHKGMTIRWKLAVVMAERDIRNKELARLTQMNPRSISRLKTRRRLTRIDESTLNALCKALNCQPGDLLVYEDDE